MRTYLLYELANSHGGSEKYIYKLIDSLPHEKHFGIKFQVFKYDEIALKDYDYYKVYVKLFIDKPNWKKIFEHARKGGFDVWVDVFDLYSVGVIKDNLQLITGIKMQSSVLDNLKVLEGLSKVIGEKKISVILNIAGRELDNIRKTLANLKSNYFPKNEIIIQAGFQAYPTDKKDLTLSKIHLLSREFPEHMISYADHVDGQSSLAFDIPVFAILARAKHIEKHVCLNRKKTKYDFQSAIEPHECASLINKINECEKILGTKFVAEKEAVYLKTTIEKPVTSKNLHASDIINFQDLEFKRTSQEGLTVPQIKSFIEKKYLLAKDLEAGKTITQNNIKKAKVGVIIACRMKSTRLKQKAILPIQGLASIERCILNAKKIRSADEIILATSTTEQDQILKKYALKHKIKFFTGDPDDVIMRYLEAAKKYNLDVIIRITGDCPVVSHEMAEFLLKRHFEQGNDYTAPKEFADGQNSEIYNVNSLKRVIEYLGNAKHSEYMSWYMEMNKDIFRAERVELPKEWVRTYRLNYDVPEDLEMFNALFAKLGNKEPNIKNIFQVLDKNPQIVATNIGMKLKYKTDKKLIATLNKEAKIKI